MKQLLVVAQIIGDDIKQPTKELIQKGKDLGLSVSSVVIGKNAARFAQTLADMGSDKQFIVEHEKLNNFSAQQYASAIKKIIDEHGFEIVWLVSNESAKALAPIIAIKCATKAVTDVVNIQYENGEMIAHKSSYAGKIIQQLKMKKQPIIAVIRASSFSHETNHAGSLNAIQVEPEIIDTKMIIKEVVAEMSEELDLTEAKFVVGVGRGCKGPDGVEFVRKFAKTVGAAFGSSRAVVDAGWLPHNKQVGQTGKMIAPTLYIAVGISGAIQHAAGISNTKIICAINNDPEAPIFSFANYGIVGDLFETLPLLQEQILAIKNT